MKVQIVGVVKKFSFTSLHKPDPTHEIITLPRLRKNLICFM